MSATVEVAQLPVEEVVRRLRAHLSLLSKRDREFAESLISSFDAYGHLWPRQEHWLHILRERTIAASLSPKPEAGTLLPIVQVLKAATAKLKNPRVYLTYGTAEYVLSIAGPASKVPGSVNVMTRGSFVDRLWFGRITPDGVFEANPRASHVDLVPMLSEFAADPLNFLKLQGKQFGQCCLCGRELTTPVSIAAGIGPICVSKFGL